MEIGFRFVRSVCWKDGRTDNIPSPSSLPLPPIKQNETKEWSSRPSHIRQGRDGILLIVCIQCKGAKQIGYLSTRLQTIFYWHNLARISSAKFSVHPTRNSRGLFIKIQFQGFLNIECANCWDYMGFVAASYILNKSPYSFHDIFIYVLGTLSMSLELLTLTHACVKW